MGITAAGIRNKLDRLTTRHGKTIEVHKFQSQSEDRYRQGTSVYAAPVVIAGRGILNPTQETLSFIGNDEEVDAAFLFDRVKLETAFPAADENDWISDADKIVFESREYAIIRSHATGRAFGDTTEVVVLAKIPQGKRTTPA